MYSISKIKRYTRDLNQRDFINSDIVVDAVLENLIVIGEAVSQLSEEFKEKYQNVPWIMIKDFRNVAIHKYHSINYRIVWDILKNKIDELEDQILKIMKKENVI